MRTIILLIALVVTGCAEISERALLGQTAVEKLRSELGADIDLRIALQRDISRKNAQLEYVSAGGYSCGPTTAEFIGYRTYNSRPPTEKQLKEMKKERENHLKKTYGELATILAYGDTLSNLRKVDAERQASIAHFKKVVDTFKGYIPGGFSGVADSLLKIGKVANDYVLKGKIIAIAIDSDIPLKAARDGIVAKGIVKDLTKAEDRLFRAWDECANDRLAFIRQYDPRNPNIDFGQYTNDILRRTKGETRTPVLLFMAEYTKYMDEREAFIGRRANYTGTIDAIVNANSKIANLGQEATFDDLMKVLAQIGEDVNTAKTQSKSLEENLGRLKL